LPRRPFAETMSRLRAVDTRGHALALVTALAATTVAAAPAHAQSLQPFAGDVATTPAALQNRSRWDDAANFGARGVTDRERGAYQPDRIRVGPFNAQLEADIETSYEDNVYGNARDRVGDFSVALSPRIRLYSQFSRHVLNIDLSARLTDYVNENALDTIDASGTIEGALHINHAHSLSFSLESDYVHENRLALGAPDNAREKTPIHVTRVRSGLTRDAGRLSGSIGFGYDRFDFFDVDGQNGQTIDQDFRDSETMAADVNLNYAFSPGFSVIGRIEGSRTFRPSSDPATSDAWGLDIVAGVKGELTPLVHWSFVYGIGTRDFDDTVIEDQTRQIFEANMRWLATETINVHGGARRTFGFTNSAAGSVNTHIWAGVDFEIYRNAIFTVSGAYQFATDLATDETAEWVSGRAELTYLHSKHLHFSARYEGAKRFAASDTDPDLDENRFWLRTKVLF